MANMSPAQVTAELYRKAKLGQKPTSSANMAQYNSILKVLNASNAVTPPVVAPKPIAPVVQKPAPGTPESAQAWINNPASGLGGVNNYANNNISRYKNNAISYEQLVNDSKRVGYDISGVPQPEPPPPSEQEQLLKNFMDIFNGFAQQQNTWQEQAKAQADRAFQERSGSINNLISSLTQNQNADLEAIQSGLAGTKQDLEDKGFQNYLAARQQMANNGLAGSGLASDQDTRLLLAHGRDLSRASQNALASASKVRAGYSGQLANAQQQLAGLSQSDMESQFYNSIFATGNKALMDKADIFMKMFKEVSGYDLGQDKLGFQYDKLSSETQRFYDKLNSDEKIAYAKMDNSNQQLAAKLTQEYNVRMTQIMGMDANGRPTIDAQKLAETIRHNGINELNDAASISNAATNNTNKLAEDVRQFDAKFGLEADKLKNTQWAQQASNLKSLLTAKGNEISTLVNAIKNSAEGSPERVQLQQQLQNAISQHESYALTLDDLTWGKAQGQGSKPSVLKSLWDATFGKMFKKSGK